MIKANYVPTAAAAAAARLKLLLKVFSLKKDENEKETVLKKHWQTMCHLEVAQKPKLIRA